MRGMSTLVRSSLILALGLMGFGCSALVDAGRVQCSNDADCTKRGAGFADTMCVESVCRAMDPWSCANHPKLVATDSAPIPVDFTLFDAITQMPIDGAKTALCGKLDVECASPMAEGRTSSQGTVHFNVSPLLDGYVLITNEGYDPTMMFLPPVLEAVNLGAYPLTSIEAVSLLGQQLGQTLMAGTGRLLTISAGCDHQTASGVALTGEKLGDSAVGFYAVGGLPSLSATATDSSGFAGFLNVEPGSITLNAKAENGHKAGRVALLVRPGYVSIRRIQPWTD
jgi:hypothetical protein